MGQAEILEFLENKRVITDEYFTVKDIQKGLKDMGLENGSMKGVHGQVLKLVIYNLIEWKGIGYWNHHKEFRGRKDGN